LNKEELQELINNHYANRTDFVKAILPYTEPEYKGALSLSQSNTAKKLSKQLNGSIGINNAPFYRLWFETKIDDKTRSSGTN